MRFSSSVYLRRSSSPSTADRFFAESKVLTMHPPRHRLLRSRAACPGASIHRFKGQGRTGDRAFASASGPTADKDLAAAQSSPAFAANSSAFEKRCQWFKGRQQSSRARPCRSIWTSRSCRGPEERTFRHPRLCTKRGLRNSSGHCRYRQETGIAKQSDISD